MTSSFASLQVLVVEDEDSQRALMKAWLAKLGINCFTAEDGVEALEMLLVENQHIDVIFTDNQMPMMDGPDLILWVRERKNLGHIKLAMASANLSDSPLKSTAETALRIFLTEHDVLPIPKDGLNSAVLKEALEQLLGT